MIFFLFFFQQEFIHLKNYPPPSKAFLQRIRGQEFWALTMADRGRGRGGGGRAPVEVFR